MKKSEIDRLIQAAFEGETLEGLDASSKQELERLTSVKADLRRLAEPPPCQLTADRVRRAINREAFKPVPRRMSQWAWGAAGAAACAVVAAAFLPGSWSTPSRVPAPVAAVTAPSSAPSSSLMAAGIAAREMASELAKERINTRQEQPAEERPVRRTRRPAAASAHAPVSVATASVRTSLQPEPAASSPAVQDPSDTSGAPEDSGMRGADPGAAGPPVVVIGAGSAGAANAVEVGRHNDLAFGG